MSKNTGNQNPYNGLSLAQTLATMIALLVEESLNHFRMGLLYIYVVDSKLLEGTEHKSAMDFFCGNIQEVSRSALAVYAAVARAFSQEQCQQFGMTRLGLLLSYKKAAKIELNDDELGNTSIKVPDSQGEAKPTRFADCTVEDLRQAVAHARSPTPSQPIPPEHRVLYDGYLQAVTSRFPKGTPTRVQMRTQDGTTMIIFAVPIVEVDKLYAALGAQLDPSQDWSEEEVAAAVGAEPVSHMS